MLIQQIVHGVRRESADGLTLSQGNHDAVSSLVIIEAKEIVLDCSKGLGRIAPRDYDGGGGRTRFHQIA